jgi:hypothetical protein
MFVKVPQFIQLQGGWNESLLVRTVAASHHALHLEWHRFRVGSLEGTATEEDSDSQLTKILLDPKFKKKNILEIFYGYIFQG